MHTRCHEYAQTSQWATVSEGYRRQLLAASRMAPLLRTFAAPFACASGICLAARARELQLALAVSLTEAGRQRHGHSLGPANGHGPGHAHGHAHAEAKAALQLRCFGPAGVRPGVPLLCFVGRIASQKGVHLLLDPALTLTLTLTLTLALALTLTLPSH